MKHLKLVFPAVFGLAGCVPLPFTGSGPNGGTVELVVLGTTDVHGHMRGWDYFANGAQDRDGLSRAATVFDSIRAANPGRVLLFDAGDLLQGTPLTYVPAKVTQQRLHPVVAAMNATGYDASAIGNHEFNYGIGFLDSAIAGARFPFLSANTRRMDGGSQYRGWTIVERAGVKVGVIGLTTPGVVVWDSDMVKGKLILDDLVATAKRAVPEVRAAGADLVVVLSHSGLSGQSSYDESTGVPPEDVTGRVAREVPGIDLIIYGHSHRSDSGTVIGETMVIQPKNWATSVSAATFTLARKNGKWAVVSRKGTLVPVAGRAESPAILAATETGHTLAMQYANARIGTTASTWKSDSARLRDTPIADFVLEVARKFTGAQLASASVFNSDAVLGPGAMTAAQIARVYPYENTLKVIRITGQQLREYLDFSSRFFPVVPAGAALSTPLATDPKIPGYNFDIVSGVDYVMDLSRPFGERITSLTYKGRPVSPTDTFTMAINNYRQSGGGGYSMIQSAPLIKDTQSEIRQLLIDEVKEKGTLRPEDYFTQNWRIVRGDSRPTAVTGPRLRVISTNDFHGALVPGPDAQGVVRGGAAHVARAIETARAECSGECVSILVDGGDLFQGTAVSNLAYGRAVVEYYNKMRYDLAVVGNHEFDWGVDTLRARMRESRFPYLGLNVRYADGRDVPWIPNDTIIQRGNWKIGVIGFASVTTPRSTRSTIVAGMRFDPPAPLIDSVARVMRAKGVDAIIAVEHDGGFCAAATGCNGEIFRIVAGITEKIDLMVSGHSHALVNTVVNGIPIVQARSSGRAIAVVDIPLPRAIGSAVAASIREISVDSMQPVASVDSIVSSAVARIGPLLSERVGVTPVDLPRAGTQYALGNIIADAFRAAGKADFAIGNTAGIRAPLRAGPITYAQLFEVQPFANNLIKLQMRGWQFKEYLERLLGLANPGVHVSGFTVSYNPEKPVGQRTVSILLPEGRTVSDAAMYSVVINDFMLVSEPYAIRDKSIPARPIPFTDFDAVRVYLGKQPQPLKVPADPRLIQVIE